jgi:hypothetical protein
MLAPTREDVAPNMVTVETPAVSSFVPFWLATPTPQIRSWLEGVVASRQLLTDPVMC